jgi:acyl-CoA reductase-like NAD-dependent aldehyde dehydrogenase
MVNATAVAAHLIGGDWQVGTDHEASRNPAHPNRSIIRYPIAGKADVDAAVSAARQAFGGWAQMAAPTRGQIIMRAATLLAERISSVAEGLTQDEGKPLADARGEVMRGVDTLRFHAAQAWAATGERFASDVPSERVWTESYPVGVVGVITPFNFPIVISAYKLAPALVQGNTVVWKPSELDPQPALLLAQILQEAGLPPGVLNVVFGDAPTGVAITANPEVDAITFTGSVPVGLEIVHKTVERGARVQVEMGGHNPAIVLGDADLPAAARAIVRGAMSEAGQKCTSTRRVIARDDCHDALEELLATEIRSLRVGDGMDGASDLGPLISAKARDGAQAAVDRSLREGARVQVGGNSLDKAEYDGGYFFEPTLISGVTEHMFIAQTEVFAPMIGLLRARDDDHAVELANSTDFGLTASLFTRSEAAKRRFIRDLEVGTVRLNRYTTGSVVNAPFHGVRKSGAPYAPAEQGFEARRFYTTTKTIYAEP